MEANVIRYLLSESDESVRSKRVEGQRGVYTGATRWGFAHTAPINEEDRTKRFQMRFVLFFVLQNHFFTICAASRASASMASKSPASRSPPGTIQLPPQHSTFGSARYSAAFCALIPPVGMNFILP